MPAMRPLVGAVISSIVPVATASGVVAQTGSPEPIQGEVVSVDGAPGEQLPLSGPGDVDGRVLAVGEHAVRAGDAVVVPITLEGASGIAAIEVTLRYDPDVLEAVSVEPGSLVSGAHLVANAGDAGIIRLAMAASPGAETAGEGTLASVHFTTVGPDSERTGLFLDMAQVRDAAGADMRLDVEHGLVRIGDAPDHGAAGDRCLTHEHAFVALAMAVGELDEDLSVDHDGDLRVTAEDAHLILRDAHAGDGCAEQPDESASTPPPPDDTLPTQLPGEPSDSAAGAIPRIGFHPDGGYAEDPGSAGIIRSFDTLLIVFDVEATVGDVNDLLSEIGATIVGGIPGIDGQAAGILFLRVPTTGHAQMDELVERLEREPLVDVVLPDALQEPDLQPPDNTALASMVATPQTRCTGAAPCVQQWTWEREDQPQPRHAAPNYEDGNWGLELIRVPQMWNLNAAIEKAAGDPIVTGIIDGGFVTHEDLGYQWSGTQHRHGTHVAGTIGAAHGNGAGIEGITPSTVFTLKVAEAPTVFSWFVLSMGSMINGVYDMVGSDVEPRAINISMGYRYKTPPTAKDQARVTAEGRAVEQTFALLSLLGHELPLVVMSVGNDSGVDARWNSGFNNAALVRGADNVIVVEALQRGTAAAPNTGPKPSPAGFSNINGDISAPGALITSAYWSGPPFNTTTNQAPGNCAGTNPKCYGTSSGTSMAAPHVTGVASHLFSLDPSLSAREVRTLLTTNSVPVAGASDQIDAFASALDIDSLRDTDRVRRMLLDIDDGTPDGNRRAGVSLAAADAEDADGDGGIGDGSVDMSDFRRWRDWLLITERSQIGDDWHFKDDVNGNGRLTPDGDDENVFPRGDFNGDGRLDRKIRVPVAGNDGGGIWTDLDVLGSVFSDDWYDASELPELIDSWDLEVDVSARLESGEVTRAYSWIKAEGGSPPLGGSRTHRDGLNEVFTVPAGVGYRAWLEAIDATGGSIYNDQEFSGEPGEDRLWRPLCTASPPDPDPDPERGISGSFCPDGFGDYILGIEGGESSLGSTRTLVCWYDGSDGSTYRLWAYWERPDAPARDIRENTACLGLRDAMERADSETHAARVSVDRFPIFGSNELLPNEADALAAAATMLAGKVEPLAAECPA